jgi:hypothetical protein
MSVHPHPDWRAVLAPAVEELPSVVKRSVDQ